MQLSHKELHSNWLISLPPKKESRGSKQAYDDAMGDVEGDGESSSGDGGDYPDDDGRRISRDSRESIDDTEPVPSTVPMDTELERQHTAGRYLSTSHNRSQSRGPPEFQHSMPQHNSRERLSGLEGGRIFPSGLSDPRRPQLSPHTNPVRDLHDLGHTGGSSAPLAFSEYNPGNSLHREDHGPLQANHDQHAYRSEPRHYHSQSLADAAMHPRRDPIRESLSQNLEAVDANRDQGEMFSRLDILLAAAEEPAMNQREHREADTRISNLDFASQHHAPIPPDRLPHREEYSKSRRRAVDSVLAIT